MTDDQNTSKPATAAGWWDRFLTWLAGFSEGSYGAELDAMRDRVEALERAGSRGRTGARPERPTAGSPLR